MAKKWKPYLTDYLSEIGVLPEKAEALLTAMFADTSWDTTSASMCCGQGAPGKVAIQGDAEIALEQRFPQLLSPEQKRYLAYLIVHEYWGSPGSPESLSE